MFFEKREKAYPLLAQVLEGIYHTTEITQCIDQVFDKAGNVRDDASPQLFEIRQRMKILRNQINRNFEREMRKLLKDKVLGETTESVVY